MNDTNSSHDLLVAALAQIEMHPETWKQSTWRCETGMCLAGWMAELSPEVEWDTAARGTLDTSTLSNGQHVGDWAAEQVFGIEDDPAADALFHSYNSINDLRAGVKAVLNGESVADAIERDREERAS